MPFQFKVTLMLMFTFTFLTIFHVDLRSKRLKKIVDSLCEKWLDKSWVSWSFLTVTNSTAKLFPDFPTRLTWCTLQQLHNFLPHFWNFFVQFSSGWCNCHKYFLKRVIWKRDITKDFQVTRDPKMFT